jgi:hypothetical protein
MKKLIQSAFLVSLCIANHAFASNAEDERAYQCMAGNSDGGGYTSFPAKRLSSHGVQDGYYFLNGGNAYFISKSKIKSTGLPTYGAEAIEKAYEIPVLDQYGNYDGDGYYFAYPEYSYYKSISKASEALDDSFRASRDIYLKSLIKKRVQEARKESPAELKSMFDEFKQLKSDPRWNEYGSYRKKMKNESQDLFEKLEQHRSQVLALKSCQNLFPNDSKLTRETTSAINELDLSAPGKAIDGTDDSYSTPVSTKAN